MMHDPPARDDRREHDAQRPLDPASTAAIRQLRRRLAVVNRRIQEHISGPCPLGGFDNPCPWIAAERAERLELWRALRQLGAPDPADWGFS